MEQVRKLEKSLGELYKGAPPLSKTAKESIVNVWPWVALVFGVLQILAAWTLWQMMDRVQPFVDFANSLSQNYGTGEIIGYSGVEKFLIYVSIATLVASGVLLLMAVSPLKNKVKRGWDLLFIGVLLNVVYAVLAVFIDGRGFGTFLVSMLGTAIGLYFLFQIKGSYTAKGTESTNKPVHS